MGDPFPQRLHQPSLVQAGHGCQQPVGYLPAGHRNHRQYLSGRLGQRLHPAAEQVAQGRRQFARAGPHHRQQFLGEERVALRPSEHALHQVGGWDGAEDPDQLRPRLDLVQPGQLDAFHRAAAVQLGQVGGQPLLARFVVAVGGHHQDPLPPQVADQERQQVAGGAVGPMQILHHQHQRSLLAQAPEQPEQ